MHTRSYTINAETPIKDIGRLSKITIRLKIHQQKFFPSKKRESILHQQQEDFILLK